jgi:hypothetical protein
MVDSAVESRWYGTVHEHEQAASTPRKARCRTHAARRRCVACMVKCIPPVCTAENSDRVCEPLASRGVAQPRARPSSTAPTQVSKRNVTARPRRPSAGPHSPLLAGRFTHEMTTLNYTSLRSRERPQPAQTSRAAAPATPVIGCASLSASEYTMALHSNYCLATESICPDAIARPLT